VRERGGGLRLRACIRLRLDDESVGFRPMHVRCFCEMATRSVKSLRVDEQSRSRKY
jgi:hypothetical protein